MNTIEISQKESVIDKIHREVGATQDRRHKLSVLKLTFVTTLLGFGGFEIFDIKDSSNNSYQPLLFLAPFAAIFFDLLSMGEHYSIRRLGAFLRNHAPEELERQYEVFVSRNRDLFFTWGYSSFTILSFIAAVLLLYHSQEKPKNYYEWGPYLIWVVSFSIAFFAIRKKGRQRLAEMDDIEIENQSDNIPAEGNLSMSSPEPTARENQPANDRTSEQRVFDLAIEIRNFEIELF
jgi:hypothetical protein